jgi:O-antigen/teichoic acid export membrane protein
MSEPLIGSENSEMTVTAATTMSVEAEATAVLDVESPVQEQRHLGGDPAHHDLKRKTARGALVSTFGQGSNFVLRLGSMIILARLLTPEDFGLVGMVTACTGFLGLFRDAGLSMATIQRAQITHEQTSALFWINGVVGALLAALCVVMAPFLTRFYHEPRLLWLTIAAGAGFVFNGLSAQHRAVLQRELRFGLVTAIDLGALVLSIGVGIAMAVVGMRYWALVGMALTIPVISAFALWIFGGWLPGLPRRGADVLSMIRYGGTVTLNTVIVYVGYNMDKVLIGRFLGAEALGIYGRAYQLINIPNDNLNSAIGLVAFPALSRLQNDAVRLKNYFLKGFGLFLSLVMPITTGSALFAEDIVRVFLGSKWGAAVPVFRLLAPTILAFAIMNPQSWLMFATGRPMRSLKIALVITPVVILGYVAGLSYGTPGVAAGFSISTVILALPVIAWARQGTSITFMDEIKVIMRPLIAVLIGAVAALAAWHYIQLLTFPLARLILANAVLFGVYAAVLLFGMGQREVYLSLMRDMGIWPIFGRKKPKSAKPGL